MSNEIVSADDRKRLACAFERARIDKQVAARVLRAARKKAEQFAYDYRDKMVLDSVEVNFEYEFADVSEARKLLDEAARVERRARKAMRDAEPI